jgi:hypothetical protein
MIPEMILNGILPSIDEELRKRGSLVDPLTLRSGLEQRRTFMIRCLPKYLKKEELIELLEELLGKDDHGIKDVVFPTTRQPFKATEPKNRGYAFIRFASPICAASFIELLPTSKVLGHCTVLFANLQQ